MQVKRFVQNDNGPRKITKDIIVNRYVSCEKYTLPKQKGNNINVQHFKPFQTQNLSTGFYQPNVLIYIQISIALVKYSGQCNDGNLLFT